MNGTGPFVIGINGPPQIGKGWLAGQLSKILPYNSRIMSLAEPLREEAMKRDRWTGLYEDFKKHVFLDGQTGRDRMIQLGAARRAVDINYWSKRLVTNPKYRDEGMPIILIDDLGFPDEQIFLETHCEIMLTIVIAPFEICTGSIYMGDSRVCLNHYDGIRASCSGAALEKFKIRLKNAADCESSRIEERSIWFSRLLDSAMD